MYVSIFHGFQFDDGIEVFGSYLLIMFYVRLVIRIVCLNRESDIWVLVLCFLDVRQNA